MAKCNQLTPLPFKGLNSLPVNLDSLSSINFVHKLEKLAIKNGMSLQATQCDVTSNLNFFGGFGTATTVPARFPFYHHIELNSRKTFLFSQFLGNPQNFKQVTRLS